MKNSPEITPNGIVPVLSISPMEEDHFFLQDILNGLQGTLVPGHTFAVTSCATLASALAALRKRQFEVVACERDLPPGSWKDVLDQVTILPDPPAAGACRHFPACRRTPVGRSPEPGCL